MGLFTKSIKRSKTTEADNLNNEVPAWLKMLQDNSWELEILISGGAIFSLFGLSDFVTEFFRTLSNTSTFGVQNLLYILSMLATKALTLGFFTHILLRSFWISLVALSSMFNNDGSQRKIKFAKPFHNQKSENLSEYIVKLDRLSAWMIYNSFTMAFIIAGWMLLMFVIVKLAQFTPDSIGIMLEPIGTCLFIMYLADFLLFSLFRKIPYLSYLIFPFFKTFDFISLRFVYQPGFDYLSRHVSKWKISLFYICFVVFALIFTYVPVQKRLHWHNIFDSRKYKDQLTSNNEFHTLTFYRSLNAEGTERVSIQSDIITEPVLNLHIGYSIRYEEFIDKIEDNDQRYFQNIFDIKVDDSLYTKQKFYSTTLFGSGPTDRGISTYVDVSSFKNGLHELTIMVKPKYVNEEKETGVVIPFWLHKETFNELN